MTALSSFIQISDALIEFNAEICGESLANSSVHSLEVHKEELRAIWSRVKPCYEASLKELLDSPDDNTRLDVETLKSRYQSTYQTYVNSIARISEYIESKRAPPAPSSSHVSPGASYMPSVHLPPCDTDPFGGDYLSWPTFRDLFTAIYINNPRLSPVEKLFHLNSKTRGEAKEVVRKAPLTNEGFEVAWKALQHRFENKRLLINSQLRSLFNIPKSNDESGSSIKDIQSTINGAISALSLYKVEISSWDPIFVYLCCTRLSETTLSIWEQSLTNKTESPTWKEMDAFLTNRFQTLETVGDFNQPSGLNSGHSQTSEKSKAVPKLPNLRRVNSYQNSLASPHCKLCPEQVHTIRLCPKFLNLGYQDKVSHIRKYNLCLNCFGKGHNVKACKSAFNCLKCQKRHNTLLHRNEANPPPTGDSGAQSGSSSTQSVSTDGAEVSQPTSVQVPPDTIHSCTATTSKMVLLGTAMVDIVHHGEHFRARALFDSGSEASFISEHLFNLLKLPCSPTSAQISGLNGAVSAKSQKICSFVISSPIDDQVSLRMTAIVLPTLTSCLPTFTASRDMFRNLPDICLADPEFYRTNYVDLLIGSDLLPLVMLGGIRTNVCHSLMAQETIFGWILTGPVQPQSLSSFRTGVSYSDEMSLESRITKFWEMEDLPRRKSMSDGDRFCEENYKLTTRRDPNGRYIVTLPFKAEFPTTVQLGQSKSIATAQFIRNESRLMRTPSFKEQYDSVLLEYLHLNHMRPITSSNFEKFSCHYYLPHHAVVRPHSVTTKVRVVFNASNPTSNGVSLNDVLYCGPPLQSDLTLLLLQWRFYRVVFNSDIEKMYRQILVDEKHTPFQRVLHRKSPQDDIHEYELKTVTFGLNCAPYLAIRTLQQLAEDVKAIYPIASRILNSQMYVDDVLGGSYDVESAVRAKAQLIRALESAGFILRKWTSNSKDFIETLPKEHLLDGEVLNFDDHSSTKTLGFNVTPTTNAILDTQGEKSHKERNPSM
ncbi:uncharacterized protein LOC131996176 [Stomoxys calcitrans]|uniref:uncharacterized protein LOC131996176 n=1 Tax=Stomoxys calcitrans TaxID=35570 RepID=UPI0027E296B8|nr:uncharacterized protein LOC131996176 [Stomoxys calcitrans]